MVSIQASALPVELHFYNEMVESIEKLKGEVTSRKMELSTFGSHIIVNSRVLRKDRLDRVVDYTRCEKPRIFYLIRDLTYYHNSLDEAQKDLLNFKWQFWCDQGKRGTYGHKTDADKAQLTFNIQGTLGTQIYALIGDTIDVVNRYIIYCKAIQTASKKNVLGMTSDCELSKYLQKQGIDKQEANQTCARLGAVLVEHLTHIEIDKIWALPILNASKMKLQELVRQRAQDKDSAVRALRETKEKSTLAEMHAFLEEL